VVAPLDVTARADLPFPGLTRTCHPTGVDRPAVRSVQVLTLLHVSDLHFGPPFVEHVGEALLRAAQELPADVIVASGDFTQRARREQYAAGTRIPRPAASAAPRGGARQP
jgi:predicted MPP superfamily phosphohydrolase